MDGDLLGKVIPIFRLPAIGVANLVNDLLVLLDQGQKFLFLSGRYHWESLAALFYYSQAGNKNHNGMQDFRYWIAVYPTKPKLRDRGWRRSALRFEHNHRHGVMVGMTQCD